MPARRTINDLLAAARRRLERVHPADALDAIRCGAVLVDIRSERQRQADGVIPGALFHPRNVLEWRVDPASGHSDPALGGNLHAWLVIVCDEGYQSSLAAATLKDLGFTRATDLVGGFQAWRTAGLPVEPPPAVAGTHRTDTIAPVRRVEGRDMSTQQDDAVRSDVLLVGSLPFDTAEEAMRAAGSGLRGHVGWLPDGEVGERVNWVGMLPLVVFPNNPDLEETVAPPEHQLEQPDKDAEQPPAEDLEGFWLWRIKPGHKVRFDDLAYARFATESYAVLKRLRDEGAVPQGVRFQLSLPAPHSAIDGFFEDPDQWPELYAAYLEGIRGEIRKVLDVIPADDLVIQWDAAWEFVDMAMGDRNYFKFWPKLSAEEKFQRHAEQLDDLWQGIPDETLLGYHWCYGTWGGWPMTAMADLDLCVRMSNEAKRRTGRRLDYVHMPVIRQPDEDFFAPLNDLDIGDTKVFLGIVHHTDGIEDFRRRRDLARQHLRDFGIGSVCGYGRVEPELLPEILRIHVEDANEL